MKPCGSKTKQDRINELYAFVSEMACSLLSDDNTTAVFPHKTQV